MSQLHLYTVFHLNLAFSSIPRHHYPAVLERCYWPLLDLLQDERIQLGIELPAYTLEQIQKLDATFVETLARKWQQGRCEVIGAGYSQSILPLMPAEANRQNLELGQEVYRNLLGRVPTTAYVNEQAYSAGIVSLYRDTGYQRLLMEWNNPYKHHRFDRRDQFFPQVVVGADGTRMELVWNNSISFQRFQRYVHGTLPFDAYLAYLEAQHDPGEDRAFLLYGSDLEIFDYRPGETGSWLQDPANRPEFDRIRRLFEHLTNDSRFAIATPAAVAERFRTQAAEHRLESPEWPIPVKKQEKYNITRWAVTGRDAVKLNGQCYRLLGKIRTIAALRPQEATVSTGAWKELCYLWSSDFRTNTTDEKHLSFTSRMGAALGRARAEIDDLARGLPEAEVVLANPHPFVWAGAACELLFEQLPVGGFREAPDVELDGEVISSQVEEVARYRDGSIRRARLLIMPSLVPRHVARGRLVARRSPPRVVASVSGGIVETPAVRLELDARTATIRRLWFKELGEEPLVGTIPHGTFEDISYGADFYSGHLIIETEDRRRITDLAGAAAHWPDDPGGCTLRVPVGFRVRTEAGEFWKVYHVHVDQPRVDITYHLRLSDLRSASFRLGIVTALPGAFDRSALRYETINGGDAVERFALAGRRVAHGAPVGVKVSASHCLGATEGWVSFGDAVRGVAVVTDKRGLCPVPMVEYDELEEGGFLRIEHSLGELDDISKCLWRGHSQVTFSLVGHANDLEPIRDLSRAANSDLLFRYNGTAPDPEDKGQW